LGEPGNSIFSFLRKKDDKMIKYQKMGFKKVKKVKKWKKMVHFQNSIGPIGTAPHRFIFDFGSKLFDVALTEIFPDLVSK
jgi:hypothetical protein